ncbi:unnamed protein product (macronuclear) [Paramecium tetraurelia]|uniref:B box-type domain-containing protein n=1 Tax=Paramecium tetraurelia TaxID=5888 RepID=A0EHA2_PARTE|nr:uncharacterized protein GSPATT00027017001 [Paramecium tetraurelia]CAK94693.1 unnamed protein product [Paramecium tetraurelia]|eukprot:XP_001462066.1 hypothetical protein (macronuclear) [Paramecium tetraurelia strain d4-2]
MNSQLNTCFLHSSQIQYFCQDCDISLCETCLLTQHYQHTLTYYVPIQDQKLKILNGKHIKWLQEQEQEVDVLQKIIQFQIQEKQNINHTFNKPLSKSNYLQISNQILNSDHQTIVFNFIEKIITQNEDFEYEDQQQLYLNAIEYKLNQNLWQKLCLQLSLSEKLQILSINLCSSTLNTNLLQQLIESISNLQNLLYVELDMKHTYLDDNSIQVLSGVMKIPNLIKFIAYVSQCNIAVGTLHQFWKRNKEQIREKFNYFYIYHHFYSFGHDKDFYEEIMASKSSIYLDQFSESTFV